MADATHALEIIGVGSPMIDRLVTVSDAWLGTITGEKGGMNLVDGATIGGLVKSLPGVPIAVAGGSAANTTLGLATLGARCTFLGKLGQDGDGELYRGLFRSAGIDIERFKVSADTPTGQCLCLITPDSERTMRTYLGAAATLTPEDVQVSDFAGVRHAHIEGYLLFNRELARRVLECAHAAGCTISLDLASFEVVLANRDVLDDLLDSYIDIVFANEAEAKAYTGKDDPRAALDALARHCDTAAVKIGAEGAWLRRAGAATHVPAIRAHAIDTTGAGDLWAAGFLYGWLRGRDLATCGRYGALTGAEVVQVMGAAIPSDRWTYIKEIIA